MPVAKPHGVFSSKSARLLVLALLLTIMPALADDTSPDEAEINWVTLHVQQHDIQLRHYPAEGEYLALWIASGNGFGPRHHQVASALQNRQIESWQVNLLENLFLPRGSANIRKLDPGLVADLVRQVRSHTGKKIVLLSNSYGAIPVIRGMRQWQLERNQENDLIGAIMFSPYTYQGIPSLGLAPEYIPEVYATNMPIMILQSARNGNRWHLPQLLDALRSGGSQVFFRLMPGATSIFYEEDKAAATRQHLQQASPRIVQAIQLLDKLPKPTRAAALPQALKEQTESLGLDISLKPFRGEWAPPPLVLKDTNGQQHTIRDYTGKVRIINFWATWCPPCVEEIPSLNRLREKLSDQPFELISVNYAQQAEEVRDFMQKVEVNFPVLIDRDGAEAARWHVIAFPSTFVIDAQGKIRYGVNAAIEWDSPEVLVAIRKLIEQSK